MPISPAEADRRRAAREVELFARRLAMIDDLISDPPQGEERQWRLLIKLTPKELGAIRSQYEPLGWTVAYESSELVIWDGGAPRR